MDYLAPNSSYEYAATCGYKSCRPVTTGGGTELYLAPVMHGAGGIYDDLPYIIDTLEQHCLEVRHKQFRLWDIDSQRMYLICQASWSLPPVDAEIFAGMSESMQKLLRHRKEEN
jgi:hypothetical protein